MPNTHPELFDRFWLAYPREKSRDHRSYAQECFERMAVKLAKKKRSATEIIEGANRYAKFVKATQLDQQYIPMASTFINRRFFETEYKCFDVDDKRLKELRGLLREAEESGCMPAVVAGYKAEIARLEARQ